MYFSHSVLQHVPSSMEMWYEVLKCLYNHFFPLLYTILSLSKSSSQAYQQNNFYINLIIFSYRLVTTKLIEIKINLLKNNNFLWLAIDFERSRLKKIIVIMWSIEWIHLLIFYVQYFMVSYSYSTKVCRNYWFTCSSVFYFIIEIEMSKLLHLLYIGLTKEVNYFCFYYILD
jgi:hypothetical protein